MKKFQFLWLFFLLVSVPVVAQDTILVPNFAVATHPFMVNKVSFLKDAFVIELTIENQAPSGYFCASKHIYLQNLQSRKKWYMTHSEGIPVCPDVYHFRWQGEKLTFKLYFPPLDSNIRYVDVIEKCKEHCFSIFGLILDRTMNDAVNKGYDAFDHGDYANAYQEFKKAIDENPAYPYGFLYANIIKVLLAEKNYDEARIWYQKLQKSNLLDKKAVLEDVSKEKGFEMLQK
ncbi:tetratricopeptide repeat protein [Candidatus Sulfidibacterium hydrothermale]|uniref:tetratricopeptide repeat protein n=1 Tax=Candidatus Sulfidibacterium hydrothermale TaxID=2875962 RepID=UPI001F0B689F|nr:tetratricopeptide repeat protein [Candidatus Sulfidibacterium hydrothermale]UBM62149.1 tetratricopeptide repeat protein [Candidatus Sulfidibacterium hydrothermale]